VFWGIAQNNVDIFFQEQKLQSLRGKLKQTSHRCKKTFQKKTSKNVKKRQE